MHFSARDVDAVQHILFIATAFACDFAFAGENEIVSNTGDLEQGPARCRFCVCPA